MKEQEKIDREKVLHELGRAYIEMKHNRARGFMVMIDDVAEKVSVIVYNLSEEEFLSHTIKIVEDAFSEMEEDND